MLAIFYFGGIPVGPGAGLRLAIGEILLLVPRHIDTTIA